MNAPQLILLMPTGEIIKGVEVCEPQEVHPLPVEQIVALWREHQEVVGFARALEQMHGIGRRLDA